MVSVVLYDLKPHLARRFYTKIFLLQFRKGHSTNGGTDGIIQHKPNTIKSTWFDKKISISGAGEIDSVVIILKLFFCKKLI